MSPLRKMQVEALQAHELEMEQFDKEQAQFEKEYAAWKKREKNSPCGTTRET